MGLLAEDLINIIAVQAPYERGLWFVQCTSWEHGPLLAWTKLF
jgi:hypothetical protein